MRVVWLQVVSVGRDGAICLAEPSTSGRAETFRPARPTATYAAVKWASLKTFVTTGATGRKTWISPWVLDPNSYKARSKGNTNDLVGFSS